jgi:hypothetical protein
MVDNTSEFEGNNHLRRALQSTDAQRCNYCGYHEGQTVCTPDGEAITHLQSVTLAGSTEPIMVCEFCLRTFHAAGNTVDIEKPEELINLGGVSEFNNF